MPETAAPPAPPTPAPPSPPPTPPAGEGAPPQTPPISSPESEADHQIALMIARRGEKKAAKEGETPTPEAKQDAPKDPKETAKSQEKLGELIADTLKFGRSKPKPKADAPKTEVKPDAEPAKPAAETPKVPQTVISKKKPDPEPIDAATIARQAAAAATTAAVQALGPTLKPAPAPEPDPGEALKPQDRHKYEVAKFLAKGNQHYKNAPRQVLDQVKRAEAYASRWENQNPGKIFNPEDDDHNDFYDSLQEPWSDLEFAKAERAMEMAALKEELKREHEGELASIKETNARLELRANVDQSYNQAVGLLITGLGEDVDKTIRSGGVDKLEESDPITAQALMEAVKGMQPIIETMVQIDDPKGRIKVDMNNPLHQLWSEIVTEGENLCVGHRLDDGRVFARRADYSRMNDAQRNKHWFLTTENIIHGFVDKSAKFLSKKIKEEKDRQIKIAQSLGFVKSTATNQGEAATPEPPAPPPAKPASPTAGAGAKVGDSPAGATSKQGKLLELMAAKLRG